MVSFIVTLRQKCWYVVKAYDPPNDQPAVHWVAQALTCGPAWVGNLLVGNLKACLAQLRDQQEEYLDTVIANHRLPDQARHFTPR